MKKRFFRWFFMFLLLSILGFGWVENSFSQTQHRTGVVTRGPWQDRYRRIEIDGITYTFMPEAALYERQNSWGGGYNEKPASYYKIFNGQKVSIQAQGHRIYQLVILP